MKIDFISNDFYNYLQKKVNKNEFTVEDLNNIEEISLNAIGNNGIKNNYDFRDFEKLPNLKYVSLQNFVIKNYQTNELNRCKSIKRIQFSSCIFLSKARLLGNIEMLSFNNSKRFKIKYISALKNLKELRCSNMLFINLKDIELLKNLEKVYFTKMKIFNFKNLGNLKNLIYIKLDDCKWNKSDEQFINQNIDFER